MKAAKILSLAAALSLAVTSMANAVGVVWFEAQGVLPNSSSDGLGGSGLGRGLKVDCDVTQGLRCEWLVSVFYQNFDGGAYGWSLDIGTLDGTIAPDKFLVKDVILPLSTLATDVSEPLVNQEGFPLIWNAGGSNVSATGAPAGTYLLMQFVLSKNKRPGEFQTSAIYAGIGFGEFGGNDLPSGHEILTMVGPNQINGAGSNDQFWPDNALGNPILVINNVPEPATIGLLGLGLLTLVRRRR